MKTVKALRIKCWIVENVSPLGWATLITQALPELLEHNHNFSAYYINDSTLWSTTEIEIINWHLRKTGSKEIPEYLLTDESGTVDQKELSGISYFDHSPSPSSRLLKWYAFIGILKRALYKNG